MKVREGKTDGESCRGRSHKTVGCKNGGIQGALGGVKEREEKRGKLEHSQQAATKFSMQKRHSSKTHGGGGVQRFMRLIGRRAKLP